MLAVGLGTRKTAKAMRKKPLGDVLFS